MNVNQLIHRLKRFLLSKLPSRLWLAAAGLAVALSVVFYARIVLSQQPVVLSMLMPALDAASAQVVVQEFEAQNPNIKLNLVEGPAASNLIEDLYTSSFLLGDSPYDLVVMDVVWLPKFAAAGWLVDMTDRIPQSELADFLPADLEGGKYEGRLYRLPFRTDAGLLYYRSDLLQQAGLQPPETFEDLLSASQTLQESGAAQWGYVWQGRQYEGLVAVFVEVLSGAGGFWVNPETLEVGLDRPETLQAIEFLRSTITEGISPSGVTTYQEDEARRLFQSGNVAFMRNWPYAYPLGNAEGSAIQGKFDIKPMVHAAGQDGAGCLGGWGLGISHSTAHPQEALQVVRFFGGPQGQKLTALANGHLPTIRSLYTDPEIVARYPYYPDLLQVLERGVLRPPVAQYAQASDILQRYLSAALTNRLAPEEAMQAAANETRRLLQAGEAAS
jgi:multiple sugar transport system substrate-binding protein